MGMDTLSPPTRSPWRALLLRPKVLLIDEPSIGLSPIVVQDVFKLLRKLASQGTPVLMVEQKVKTTL